MGWLVGTFFYSIASALIPVLNAEVYLAAIAGKSPGLSEQLTLALVAAAGATVGKVIWYYAGQQSMRIPAIRKKMAERKWQESYARWHARIADRPVYGGLIVFVSAASGFPPLAVIAVLAGALRVHLGVFVVTTLLGRWVRFYTVLAGVDLLKELVPGLFA